MKTGSEQYKRLHNWVRENCGKRIPHCVNCGVPGQEIGGKWSIVWANISRKYRKIISDWIPLCYWCHSRYDNGKSEIQFFNMSDELKIGDIRYLEKDGLAFPVQIREIKKPGYGRTLALIVPVNGSGQKWVESNTLNPSMGVKKKNDK